MFARVRSEFGFGRVRDWVGWGLWVVVGGHWSVVAWWWVVRWRKNLKQIEFFECSRNGLKRSGMHRHGVRKVVWACFGAFSVRWWWQLVGLGGFGGRESEGRLGGGWPGGEKI